MNLSDIMDSQSHDVFQHKHARRKEGRPEDYGERRVTRRLVLWATGGPVVEGPIQLVGHTGDVMLIVY